MKKELSNIGHLRNILEEIKNHEFGVDPFNDKMEEAKEFLDAIQDEINDKNDELKALEEKLFDPEREDEEDETYRNSSFVGLDTIKWELENRNLRIQMQMEQFIEKLQKQNCTTTANG